MKSQTVRLIDVFVLGPLLVLWSSKARLSKVERVALLAIGVATAAYNAHNYLRHPS